MKVWCYLLMLAAQGMNGFQPGSQVKNIPSRRPAQTAKGHSLILAKAQDPLTKVSKPDVSYTLKINIKTKKVPRVPSDANPFLLDERPGAREVERLVLHPFSRYDVNPLVWLFLIPVLPIVILQKKIIFESRLAKAVQKYGPEFERRTKEYRAHQLELVKKVVAVRNSGQRDPALPAKRLVVVTMATGQEGQSVVKNLAADPGITVRALVRDPTSKKAQQLAADFPNVELVEADSTDPKSLAQSMVGAQAAYLCTTLNRANAGKWQMSWTSGEYELEQGRAFVAAAKVTPSLRQIVYGTAPLRKWDKAFPVEPPIHYAAKWEIEDMLMAAGLPYSFLRKCPYHENFTKLTRDPTGKLDKGPYNIKAFTNPDFFYNAMDPKDIGVWAKTVLDHPSLFVKESFSVASDCLSGPEMAALANTARSDGVTFQYQRVPPLLFESLAYVEPTFVYLSGLQRWFSNGGQYDLTKDGVEQLRQVLQTTTWVEHLKAEGTEQFTDLPQLPTFTKL